MRRMLVVLALAAALLAGSSGCSVIDAVATHIRVRLAADDAWVRFQENHECLDYDNDIGHGFRKGYREFVMTGRPCPMPMLPSKYCRPWYQTCFGRHEVEAWREGYLFGQSVASEDCVRGYGHCDTGRCGSGLLWTGPRSCGCNNGARGGCASGACLGNPSPAGGADGTCATCFATSGNPAPVPQSPGHAVISLEDSGAPTMIWQSPDSCESWPPVLEAPPPQFAAPAPEGIPTHPSPTERPAVPPPAYFQKVLVLPQHSAPPPPNARLELPAPTAPELPVEGAIKGSPPTQAPARNPAMPERPVQWKMPLTVPESQAPDRDLPPVPPADDGSPEAARGPSLMSPVDTPEAAETTPAAPESSRREIPATPATSAWSPRRSEVGALAPTSVGPVRSSSAPAEVPQANRGWKPLDWKPSRSPLPARPILDSSQPVPESPPFEPPSSR